MGFNSMPSNPQMRKTEIVMVMVLAALILTGIGMLIYIFSKNSEAKNVEKQDSRFAVAQNVYETTVKAKKVTPAIPVIYEGKYNTVSEHLTGGLYWIHIKDFDVVCVGFSGGGLDCDWSRYRR